MEENNLKTHNIEAVTTTQGKMNSIIDQIPTIY